MSIDSKSIALIMAHTLKPSCPECAKLKVTVWPRALAEEKDPELRRIGFVGCWQVSDMKEAQEALRKGKKWP